MFSRDESPWKSRQAVTRGELFWKAHDLAMDVIVFAHYNLRRRESSMRPQTRQAFNDTLRYVKGIAVFWERWLRVTHPRLAQSKAVPASSSQPTTDAVSLSAGRAEAPPSEHEEQE